MSSYGTKAQISIDTNKIHELVKDAIVVFSGGFDDNARMFLG